MQRDVRQGKTFLVEVVDACAVEVNRYTYSMHSTVSVRKVSESAVLWLTSSHSEQ